MIVIEEMDLFSQQSFHMFPELFGQDRDVIPGLALPFVQFLLRVLLFLKHQAKLGLLPLKGTCLHKQRVGQQGFLGIPVCNFVCPQFRAGTAHLRTE